MNSKPQLNWIYVIAAVLVSAIGLSFIGFAITKQVYGEWVKGLPISGGFNWPIVIGIDVMCLICLFAVIWKIYCDANTEIGTEHVSQPSILGKKTIRWSDVSDVQIFGGVGYHVIAQSKKIVVSPFAYLNPTTVIATLNQQIESGKNFRQ